MRLSTSEAKQVQHFFNTHGFSCGVEDGIVGDRTYFATKQYQKSKNLIPDGIIGKNTLEAMARDGFKFAEEPKLEYDADFNIPDEISKAAFDLIVEFEVGGKADYNERPEWPEGDSGVTIGIGYDIGMCRKAQVLRDWAALGSDTLERLTKCCGVSKYPAELLARDLRDIRIPYNLAMVVFCNSTLPEEIEKTKNVFEGAIDKLSKDAFGALVSLVYNRGTSIKGESRKEMLGIRQACLALSGQTLVERVASLVEAMIPIWEGKSIYSGMKRRRLAEARLIRLGGAK